MAEPTPYDLEQDARIETIESLVTAEYQPPEGTEYSFPVANQGITQDQFRTMMRAAGKGTFVASSEDGAQVAYRLRPHDSEAETNQRNTLILRPPNVSRKAESVSNGFFHVLTEDIELPFPPVTSSTTYHVCVTYDPRLFRTTPLKIEVYPGTPPTSHGREHVVLFEVRRDPNQLLSQAKIQTKAAWLSSVVTVWEYDQLPKPHDVDYGTIGVVMNASRGHIPDMYTSRGVHGWLDLQAGNRPGQWQDITEIRSTWRPSTGFSQRARRTVSGVQIDCVVLPDSGQGSLSQLEMNLFRLPPSLRPPSGTLIANALLFGLAQNQAEPIVFRLNSDGWVVNMKTYSGLGWVRIYGEVFYD